MIHGDVQYTPGISSRVRVGLIMLKKGIVINPITRTIKLPNGIQVLVVFQVPLLVLSFGFTGSVTVFRSGSCSKGQYLVSWLSTLMFASANSLCIRCQITALSAVLSFGVEKSITVLHRKSFAVGQNPARMICSVTGF